MLDLTSDTVTPETLLVGTTAHNAKGEIITGTLVARDSSDLTVSGATVNVPAGLYSSAASKSVASGTVGTPTASKSAVSNNSVTITPSVTNTTGYITGGTKTGTGVTVSASELVSGNKAITPSETAQSGIDVTNFKTASVGAISSTYVGSGVTRKAAATVAPSTSEQTVCASGVYTTGEQKVSAITPSIVGNLDASSFAASIVAAIEGKGVTVPDATLLDGMAALIESIEAGGGSENQLVYGTYTPASDQKASYGGSFSAEFGFVPDVFVMCQPISESGPTKNSAAIIIIRPYAYRNLGNPSYFRSIVSAPTGASQTGTSNHRYYGTINIMTETKVSLFGPSGSLLVGGAEYFWIAAKFA